MDTAVILCGMWALWMRRNNRRHGEALLSVQQSMCWVRDTAFDLWKLSNPVVPKEKATEKQRWKKPVQGWLKINTDAAFSVRDSSGATACIIRDDQGLFKAAQAKWYERGLDACMMEAMACRDGLQLAIQHGFRQVVVETDCLELINH